MNTIRSIAFSALAATATLTFAMIGAPTQANGLCLQRAPLYAPRIDGRMVQLAVPGMRSVVFAARP